MDLRIYRAKDGGIEFAYILLYVFEPRRNYIYSVNKQS